MSAGLRFGNRQISPVVILSVLAAVLAIFALLLPETVDESPGNSSTHSPAPAGARMAFQLAERMGWRASRREKPLASVDGRTVQVVLSPQELLGADEVHRLLENVRMGGGMMFDVLNGKEIGDSLGLSAGPMRAMLSLTADTKCKSDESRVVRTMTEILPPSVFDVKWRRPPPSAVIPIDVSLRRGVAQPVA
ncbi:MAG: DUF4350 domain-containing protein, partial [Gemmatimonadaceae bacterium]